MCVIIAIEDGKIPDLQTLKDAETWNKDGAGVAWVKDGLVHFRKGMDLKAEKIFNILKHEKPKYAVIHFRIKSSGETISELTHPFIISADSKTVLKGKAEAVLFHNGTIHSWDDDLKDAILSNKVPTVPDGPLNDSRVMAILAHYCGRNFLKLYGSQKFAVLDKNGITKYGSWVKVGKNECSNDNFVKKETEAHLKSDWYFCETHYRYNCKICTGDMPALPAVVTDDDDYYLKMEMLEQKYRDTNDPQEAKRILEQMDELDNASDMARFYWPRKNE